jgi:hypothetical protein
MVTVNRNHPQKQECDDEGADRSPKLNDAEDLGDQLFRMGEKGPEPRCRRAKKDRDQNDRDYPEYPQGDNTKPTPSRPPRGLNPLSSHVHARLSLSAIWT